MTRTPDLYDECATAMQGSEAWPAVFGAGTARLLAIVTIRVLRNRGLLNEYGIAAAQAADRSMEATNG